MHGYIDDAYTLSHTRRRGAGAVAAAPVAARAPAPRSARTAASVRRFSTMLLATWLSTLIVVTDRLVDAWSSGGLLLALAALWLAIYLGLVLLAPLSVRVVLWSCAAWRDLTARPRPLVPGGHAT